MYLQYSSSVTPCRKDLDEAKAQLGELEDAVRQLIQIKRDTPMTNWHDYTYGILQYVKGVLERGDAWYSDGVLWIVEARAFLPIWTCRGMLHDAFTRDPDCAASLSVVRDMLKPLEISLVDRFVRRVHWYCKATMRSTTGAQYLHYCDQQLGLGGVAQWPPNLYARMLLAYRTNFPPTNKGHDMPLFRSNSCDKAVRKNQPPGRDGLPARPAKPKTAGDPANPAYVAVADVEDVQACNVLDQPLPVAPVVVQSVDQTKCLSNVNSNVAESDPAYVAVADVEDVQACNVLDQQQ